MVALGALVPSPYVFPLDYHENPWNIILTMLQNGDGSRQPSQKELEVATAQGKAFYEAVAKVSFQ